MGNNRGSLCAGDILRICKKCQRKERWLLEPPVLSLEDLQQGVGFLLDPERIDDFFLEACG
jgi:hypothetical protein